MNNLTKQSFTISSKQRASQLQQNGKTLWFTGLSGSGKSTIANALEEILFKNGFKSYTLDGDNIRLGINKDLGFIETDRAENLRRISEIAKLFNDAGLICICAFISPTEANRNKAKQIIGTNNFLEIFINTPLEICEKRDVKGLYAKARLGEIKNFTGISAPFEIPQNPNISINTVGKTVYECAQIIFEAIKPLITWKNTI